MAHFLFSTFGSLGDLHPYIAVGLGLRDRGHLVTIATSEIYRAKVEAEQLGFHAVRPDLGPLLDDPEAMKRAFHPRTGTEYIFRRHLLPAVAHTFSDLKEAARDADLIAGHAVAFAAPTVAEVLKKPWVSIALQPAAFLSAHDPPTVPGVPLLAAMRPLGPRFWKPFLALARQRARTWSDPLNSLRKSLGLSLLRDPIIDDLYSPLGTQAWFSKVLAEPQRDWPVKVTVTGFPFYDKHDETSGLSPELARFLESGPPPVVFTLGSSAVMEAGEFFPESIRAAEIAGVRAVLLIGRDPRNKPRTALHPSLFASEYAPFSALLPRASVVVHQGGVGTTGQVLRAGCPALMVPWSHDQPDNARRVAQLGACRILARTRYRAPLVAKELRALLENGAYRDAAGRAALLMSREDGVTAACEGLEKIRALSQSAIGPRS